ncbi:hypothetical protein DFR67_10216 [Williamsia limnetica]|uniref:Uncharacterized protein n=1 Tax=Williamsia limnetica TaxID=882452 RepID=A0A318RR23_WILLI|nr:DUF5691 domain-containing protein [Williamsia limnetica]PYE19878.1 hypothetical protein DFR67_10216 [Williamsia limnetica]
MNGWDELVSAATVGVGGKALDLGELDPAIASAAAMVDRKDPVSAVLSIAALDTIATRAGMPTGPPVQVIPPAPDDQGRVMSDRLAGLLGQALDSGDEMATWAIEAMAARDVRVPPELIPMLLQRTRRHVRIRPAVAVLVGARGRWLAEVSGISSVLPPKDLGVQPESAADFEETWAYGSTPARVEVLRLWRSEDAAGALRRLETVWPCEPGDTRAALIGALEIGLSAADEVFLDQALDDRKGSVRAVAARLLKDIPGSRLQQRMIERSRRLLVASGRGRRLTLSLVLPAGVDDSAQRDGINPKPPRGTGAGTWLAGQVLQNTPLGLWESMFEKTPEILVGAVADDDAETVLGAWGEAAVAQRNATWAAALYRAPGADPALIGVLDDPKRSEAAVWWLRNRRPPGNVLAHVPAPWTDEVAATALNAALRESISPSASPLWHWRGLVDLLRLGLPVGPAYRWIEQIDAARDRMKGGWPQLLEPLKWALILRTAITEEMHDES